MKFMPIPVYLKQVPLATLLMLAATGLSAQASAAQQMHHHDNQAVMQMPETTSTNTMEDHSGHMEDHSAHMKAMKEMKSQKYKRSLDNYALPSLKLVDMHGNKVYLEEILETNQPVMVNFIYTSCTTICPLLSATFSQAQQQMGKSAQPVKWISFSIDPEYDTPARLRKYARRFHADSNWQFITGEVEQIVALQKAFDAYFGSKANHKPVTFMRAGRNQPWVRLEGLTSGAELVAEYQQITQ